ncbi:GNAT family N-acetyltransferase [Antricoccus suffuscus]|nr:GNAT family N-acetyltransferase [Antricoccus suffuscus]
MPSTYLPPHLATPQFTECTAQDQETFSAAMFKGFHEEPSQEEKDVLGAVWDADRHFGFTVDDRWIATAGSFARTMTVPGGSVPVSAFTAVTVAAPYRRRGLLTRMMQHELDTAYADRGEPISILWASEAPIYGRFGFAPAVMRARLLAETPAMGFLPQVDFGDGSVDEVSHETFSTAAKAIRTRLLADEPGALNRDDDWWAWTLFDPPAWRKGATQYKWILHYNRSGTPDGYAYFRVRGKNDVTGPQSEVQIHEVEAATPQGYASLMRYLMQIDLTRSFKMRNARPDEPLRHLLSNPRALRTEISDGIYVRIVDVAAALVARKYLSDVDVVLEIEDVQVPSNNGRFRLEAGTDGAKVTKARRKPDLSLSDLELGAIYLGGVPLSDLHRAGRVIEHKKGAAATVSAAFGWPRAPWCVDNF